MSSTTVFWANINDIERIVPLFDGYRQFYQKPSDPDLARELLEARMTANESKVVLALNEAGEACGFAQLYPLFSSLTMDVKSSKVWLLNDVFVAENGRGFGVGRALMGFVQNWAAGEGDIGYLMLETAKTNTPAQALYESESWVRDEAYWVYHFSVK